MRNYFYSKHFFYGITFVISACLLAGLLLRFYLSSEKPGEDATTLIEDRKKSLVPTTPVDTMSSKITTPTLTLTQTPSSLVTRETAPNITRPVYLLAEESATTIEVWQFSPDKGEWLVLHSVTRPTHKPENITIPPQEIERMQNYLATQSTSGRVPDVSSFERYTEYFALAPTIKQLAFVEWYSFFVDETQKGHFGIQHTGSLALETDQSQSFFQAPVQVLVDEFYYYTALAKLLWSPDAEYFSLSYDIIEYNSTPLIVNVNTGIVQQLDSTANLFGPLAWSPDSRSVVLYLYRSDFEAAGGVMRLCEIESLNCRNIELDGVWVEPSGVDWTPHRNQIVFTGSDVDFRRSASPPPFSLYLFDPETEVVHRVLDNLNRSLADPQWSPDGQFIAVEYSNEGTVASPNTIVIVEPDAEQIITEIPIEGCDWQWEQSSQSIMQLPCGRSETGSLMVFSIFDDSSQQIELPFELSLKRRLRFNILKRP